MPDTAVYGSTSVETQRAQEYLNKIAGKKLVDENGELNSKTQKLIKEFQKEAGLKLTGDVDSKLLSLLAETSRYKKADYQVKIGGNTYFLTKAEHKAALAIIRKKALIPIADSLKVSMREARGLWDHQTEISKGSFWAWAIESYAGGLNLPKESMIKAAEKKVSDFEKLVKTGDLNGFDTSFFAARKSVINARQAMKNYMNAIDSNGKHLQGQLVLCTEISVMALSLAANPAVAARFGISKIAAGIAVSGATAAGVTAATEISKGVNGISDGTGTAVKNVVFDGVIGAALGALLKGGLGKEAAKKVAAHLVKKMSKTFLAKMSTSGAAKFAKNFLVEHGPGIVQDCIKDVMVRAKSTSGKVTLEWAMEMIAKNIVLSPIFRRIEKSSEIDGKTAMKYLSPKKLVQIKDAFPSAPSNTQVQELISNVLGDSAKMGSKKVYDSIYGDLKGTFTEKKVQTKLVDGIFSKKVMAHAERLAAKR